jgi:cardiolipin synthase
MVTDAFGWLPGAATLVVAVAVVAVVFALATDDREPSIVLAWLFVIVLFPVIGVVAYFFVGRNHRRETKRRTKVRTTTLAAADRWLRPTLQAQAAFSDAATKERIGTPAERVLVLGQREGGMGILPADTVTVYVAGADKFRDLLEDLRGAKRYINLMYLIWERDELTAEVTGILNDRLRAGVEVRILYDWLTSLPFRKTELKQLASAGATVVPCYRSASQLNYRNHMKIAIVDGEVVYSGGMNMGKEYIDGGERFAVWRDTHLRMTGAVVTPYLWLFANIWSMNKRSEDLFTGYAPTPIPRVPGDGIAVQVLHSSVSTDFPAIRDVFITALLNARARVWIQSPYLVPDEPLLTAMCVAATAGVDVRFMMTGNPDKKVPFYAAQAYYPKLLAAGVRVYQYTAGFLHSKTVTVDDQFAIIGTCNWDIRSIILHDEVVAVLYDELITAQCADQYLQDVESCLEITEERLASLTGYQRFRNSVYRLFSRLL